MTIYSGCSWMFPSKLVIFHSYVSLPEGKYITPLFSDVPLVGTGSFAGFGGHAVCTHSGESATCMDRIHWAKRHVFAGRHRAVWARAGGWLDLGTLEQDIEFSNAVA